MLLLGNLMEEEKNGNTKDVKTRQTCRYQNGDVPPITSHDKKGGGEWRNDNGKRERERERERERKRK